MWVIGWEWPSHRLDKEKQSLNTGFVSSVHSDAALAFR